MAGTDALEEGRQAFARRAWADAYARLSAADRHAPLSPEDLERLATAAYLTGRDDDVAEAGARGHHEFLRRGEVERAVRCAFWLAFNFLQRDDQARGGGWMARARRLLDDAQLDCVEQGYLLVPGALQALLQGDIATAGAGFAEAVRIGDRFADPDLVAMGRLGLGGRGWRRGRRPSGWPCSTRPWSPSRPARCRRWWPGSCTAP